MASCRPIHPQLRNKRYPAVNEALSLLLSLATSAASRESTLKPTIETRNSRICNFRTLNFSNCQAKKLSVLSTLCRTFDLPSFLTRTRPRSKINMQFVAFGAASRSRKFASLKRTCARARACQGCPNFRTPAPLRSLQSLKMLETFTRPTSSNLRTLYPSTSGGRVLYVWRGRGRIVVTPTPALTYRQQARGEGG